MRLGILTDDETVWTGSYLTFMVSRDIFIALRRKAKLDFHWLGHTQSQ